MVLLDDIHLHGRFLLVIWILMSLRRSLSKPFCGLEILYLSKFMLAKDMVLFNLWLGFFSPPLNMSISLCGYSNILKLVKGNDMILTVATLVFQGNKFHVAWCHSASCEVFHQSYFFLLFLFILLLIGFLTFHVACVCRTSAEEAIQRMQGKMIGQQVIQISWGSSTSTARQVIVPLETVHFLTKWLNTSLNYIMINIICTFEIYENENHLIINLSSFKFYKIWHK